VDPVLAANPYEESRAVADFVDVVLVAPETLRDELAHLGIVLCDDDARGSLLGNHAGKSCM
jgi:hypothetical protein